MLLIALKSPPHALPSTFVWREAGGCKPRGISYLERKIIRCQREVEFLAGSQRQTVVVPLNAVGDRTGCGGKGTGKGEVESRNSKPVWPSDGAQAQRQIIKIALEERKEIQKGSGHTRLPSTSTGRTSWQMGKNRWGGEELKMAEGG